MQVEMPALLDDAAKIQTKIGTAKRFKLFLKNSYELTQKAR
jgi:hypothetical protein